MYAIAEVILGTILPWDDDDILSKLDRAYAVALRDELSLDADDDGDDLFNEVVLDEPNYKWTKNYHGASDVPSAYVGVALHQFDESNHFPLSKLTDLKPTEEQEREARRKYDALPETVRAVLPPFGTYVVWSTS